MGYGLCIRATLGAAVVVLCVQIPQASPEPQARATSVPQDGQDGLAYAPGWGSYLPADRAPPGSRHQHSDAVGDGSRHSSRRQQTPEPSQMAAVGPGTLTGPAPTPVPRGSSTGRRRTSSRQTTDRSAATPARLPEPATASAPAPDQAVDLPSPQTAWPDLSASLAGLLRSKAALIGSAVRGGVRAVLWLPGVVLDALRAAVAPA